MALNDNENDEDQLKSVTISKFRQNSALINYIFMLICTYFVC